MALALEVEVDMNAALRDYGNRLDEAMSSEAFFPYFGECRKRVIDLMSDHGQEAAIDLASSVIVKIWHFDHPAFAESSTPALSLERHTPSSVPKSQALTVKKMRSFPNLLRRPSEIRKIQLWPNEARPT